VRRQLLFAVLAAAVVGFAPAPFPKTERQCVENQSDLGGTWRIVLWEMNGTRESEIAKESQVEVARGQFALVGLNSTHREEYDLQIDPTSSPPFFTFSRHGTILNVGSYRLQKDRLRMILNRGDQKEKRPTDFAGPCYLRFEMRRIRR
jgi:uncharacterized protein (TIGR03067 family)